MSNVGGFGNLVTCKVSPFFFFWIGKLAFFCNVLMGMDGKERIIGGHVAHFRLKIHKS